MMGKRMNTWEQSFVNLELSAISWEEAIRPCGRNVLIRQDRRILRRKSGIILPGSEDWPPQVGWVVAVGRDVMEVEVGDYAIYEIYAGPEFKVSGEHYTIVNEADIIAVLERG